jgi:6-phosphogluconolactonase
MDVELIVTESIEQAAEGAARLLAEAAGTHSGIAVSGGSTPTRAYELAAAAEPDWRDAHLWLVDERMVPPDDARSNAHLVRSAIVDRLTAPPNLHFVPTDLSSEEAAAAYDAELREAVLHLALVGIGSDGHTASLFPHAPSLDVREKLAVAAEAGLEPLVRRVTMTIPALSSAEHVLFLVTGESKAEAVRRAFAEAPSPATPASLVRSRTGKTTAILDRAAASLLRQ